MRQKIHYQRHGRRYTSRYHRAQPRTEDCLGRARDFKGWDTGVYRLALAVLQLFQALDHDHENDHSSVKGGGGWVHDEQWSFQDRDWPRVAQRGTHIGENGRAHDSHWEAWRGRFYKDTRVKRTARESGVVRARSDRNRGLIIKTDAYG